MDDSEPHYVEDFEESDDENEDIEDADRGLEIEYEREKHF